MRRSHKPAISQCRYLNVLFPVMVFEEKANTPRRARQSVSLYVIAFVLL
jgi:hypothetical protein